MTFTPEEISKLYEPFMPEEHEVRKGYSNKEKTSQYWFVYVSRTAIQKRLDTLFPGEWSSEIVGSPQRYEDGTVTVTVCITIRGVSRCYNGSDKPDGKDFTNTEKAAFTDAFKRAASMWGIGLYLQDAPQIKTQFDGYQEQAALNLAKRWIQSGFKHDVLTGEVGGNGHVTEPVPTQWATEDNLNTLVEMMTDTLGVELFTLGDFARLAGIDNAFDLSAWNSNYKTGKHAYEAALRAHAKIKARNLQPVPEEIEQATLMEESDQENPKAISPQAARFKSA